jgi:hypothetical protein
MVWEGLLNVVKDKQIVVSVLKQIINHDASTDYDGKDGIPCISPYPPHLFKIGDDGLAQALLVLLSTHFKAHPPTLLLGGQAPGTPAISSSPHASVASVVRATLGLPVAIHGESLSQFAAMFTEHLPLPVQLPFELALRYPYIL